MSQPPPHNPRGGQPPYRPPAGVPPGQGQPTGYPQRPSTQPPPRPQQAPAGYPAPLQAPAPAAPAVTPPPVRRKARGALKFVASSCVFSGWLTLVVSLIFAAVSLSAGLGAQRMATAARTSTNYFPQAPQPSTGLPGLGSGDLDGLGGGLGAGGLGSGGAAGGLQGLGLPNPGDLFATFLPGLFFGSAAFTLLTGVVGFFLFLGLGQACYVLIDLEEQSLRNAEMLQALVHRAGIGR